MKTQSILKDICMVFNCRVANRRKHLYFLARILLFDYGLSKKDMRA